jgi:hypothetical protein
MAERQPTEVPGRNSAIRLLGRIAAASAVPCTLAALPAHALPAYAQSEAKPCSYCHTDLAGGGARTYRGLFYSLHGHAFAGFDDAAEAKRAGVPLGPEAIPHPKSYSPPIPVSAEPLHGQVADKRMSIAAATARVTEAREQYGRNSTVERRIAYAEALSDLAGAIWTFGTTPPPDRYRESMKLFSRALKMAPDDGTVLDAKEAVFAAHADKEPTVPQPSVAGTRPTFHRAGAYGNVVISAALTPDPPRTSNATIELKLSDAATGSPVLGAMLTGTATMPDMAGMQVRTFTASDAGGGLYRIAVVFSMNGTWRLSIRVAGVDGPPVSLDFDTLSGKPWLPR